MLEHPNILLLGKVAHPKTQIIKGGISRHIKDLSEELTRNNIAVSIWDYRLCKTYNENNIRIFGPTWWSKINSVIFSVFRLGLFTNRRYDYLSLKNKFIVSLQLKSLIAVLDEENFTAVHVHSLLRPIPSFLREFFPHLKIVITDHGFWQKQEDELAKSQDLISKNIQSANTIIYISDFALEKFKEYNLPLEKLVKIPNPINFETLPLLDLPQKKQIVFNGFNETLSRKNLPLLIQALETEDFFNQYSLVAIVNKKGKQYLESLMLPFKVTPLGLQPWENIVQLYNESALLVVPSLSESFGLVYLEALAVGTPIIGFNGTVEEFQESLKTNIGFPFDPINETAGDLAHKIKNCLTKSFNRQEVREIVANQYAWPYRISSFIECYS